MENAARQVDTLLPQLQPGFSVFADFSSIQSMDLDCVRPLTRIMDLCRAAGIEMIVRILPAPDRDIGIKQRARTGGTASLVIPCRIPNSRSQEAAVYRAWFWWPGRARNAAS